MEIVSSIKLVPVLYEPPGQKEAEDERLHATPNKIRPKRNGCKCVITMEKSNTSFTLPVSNVSV